MQRFTCGTNGMEWPQPNNSSASQY